MKEFEPDSNWIERDNRAMAIQAILGMLGFVFTLLGFVFSVREGDTSNVANLGTGLFFGTLAFIAGLMAIREIRQPFRNRARIMLTENAMVIRNRCEPARYLNRRDCAAFKPLTLTIVRHDGTEYALGMPGWPASLSRDSAVFVFAHWWSVERFEAIEADFAVQLPKPPQTARWYTLAIVLIVVVAIVLLGWMPGALALPGPLAAIVLLVVLRSPYAARRRVRDRERKACQYAFMQEEGSVCVVN